MSNQDANQVLQQSRLQDNVKLKILTIYAVIPGFLFFGGWISFVVYALSPPSIQPVTGWLTALFAGLLFATLTLFALLLAWFRNRLVGMIVTGLVVLGWLIWVALLLWAIALPPPVPSDSPDSTVHVLRDLLGLLVAAAPLVLALIVLAVGVRLVSGYLLPTEERRKTGKQVFNFLRDWSSGRFYHCYVMVDEEREEDKLSLRIKGNPFAQFRRGPGIIICDCDHAVAISDGIKFKGVQGPGVIFTGFGDQPVCTLDLRPQLRTETVEGLTKDGIEAKVLFFAPFQIDRGQQEPKLGEPIPYRRSAAFKIVHEQMMEHPNTGKEELKKRAWDDLPVNAGTPLMRNIISQYRFDELYDPYETEEELPRVRIAKEHGKLFDGELQRLGFQRVGGGISNLQPVRDEVLEQRVRSWQANWVRQIMLKQAKSQTEWLRRIERVRAQAQSDLILTMGQALAALDRVDTEVTPAAVMPHLLHCLEELALRPSLRGYLPKGTAEGVQNLREKLEQ